MSSDYQVCTPPETVENDKAIDISDGSISVLETEIVEQIEELYKLFGDHTTMYHQMQGSFQTKQFSGYFKNFSDNFQQQQQSL